MTPRQQFFAQYGLRDNPFPPNRSINEAVMHNQEEAVEVFASLLREMVTSLEQRQTCRHSMGLTGGTASGKTHYMRRAMYALTRSPRENGSGSSFVDDQRLVTCLWSAQNTSLFEDIKSLYSQVDDSIRRWNDYKGVVESIIEELADRQEADRQDVLSRVESHDLRNALEQCCQAWRKREPLDPRGVYTPDRMIAVCHRWLKGEALSITEKKWLGVSITLKATSLLTRVHRDLLSLARNLGLLNGIVLFIDELELLLRDRGTPPRSLTYLQDLRYFYELAQPTTAPSESSYSLLVVAASTPEGQSRLRAVNYPVYQRLGFEGKALAQLSPVSKVISARDFAVTYIEYEHDHWKRANPHVEAKYEARDILTEPEIEECFDQARGGKGVTEVAQGRLMDELHRAVEEKIP